MTPDEPTHAEIDKMIERRHRAEVWEGVSVGEYTGFGFGWILAGGALLLLTLEGVSPSPWLGGTVAFMGAAVLAVGKRLGSYLRERQGDDEDASG